MDDERLLYSVTLVYRRVDESYANSQEFDLNNRVANSTILPDFKKLLEKFRSYYRRNVVVKKTSRARSAFVTLNSQGSDKTNTLWLCLYGTNKATYPRFENCLYISPKARPNGWKGDLEIKKKVVKGINNFKFGRAWFVQNFG